MIDANDLYRDIDKHVCLIEARLSVIEGKDARDYDLLKKIESDVDALGRKMDSKEGVLRAIKTIFIVLGGAIAAFASFMGGSDYVVKPVLHLFGAK